MRFKGGDRIVVVKPDNIRRSRLASPQSTYSISHRSTLGHVWHVVDPDPFRKAGFVWLMMDDGHLEQIHVSRVRHEMDVIQ